jgi:hypothetical protein
MTALDVPHLPQQTSYWCGPAAVRMALTSKLGAGAPSQWALAQDEYLRTELHQETPDRVVIRDTLNALLGTDGYVVRDVDRPHTPAQTDLFRAELHQLDDGWPLVATFWVREHGPRPPAYPDKETKHIVAINGYRGDLVQVWDPASRGTDVVWGADVPPIYRLPIDVVMTLMEGKGYVVHTSPAPTS